MNLEKANYIRELSETNLSVGEQQEKFKEKGYGCRATFYNIRKKLYIKETGLQMSKERYYPRHTKSHICYFCLNPATLTHHINPKVGDLEGNMISLCKSCHTKIHRIYHVLKIKI